MSKFTTDENAWSSLKDKVVVMTGAATGIGAATATLLVNSGAKVVFGDIATKPAESLVQTLNTSHPNSTTFVSCDVTKYSDIYNLFRTAQKEHNHIDHAISSAGIFEQGNWFDPSLTIDTVGETSGPTAVLDVNVIGSANFARVAVVFLRHTLSQSQNTNAPTPTPSLTFLSSVNAFRESPGLYMYQTSKHAIHGLMRSMRAPVSKNYGIRTNCVCPGVTDTPMTEGIVEKFKAADLWWQTPESVARIILGLVCNKPEVNGKGVYVEGGEGWEFEDGFYREMPSWLGEEPTRRMRMNAEAVNKGALIKD